MTNDQSNPNYLNDQTIRASGYLVVIGSYDWVILWVLGFGHWSFWA